MKNTRKLKFVAVLFSGFMTLGGSCMPNNFYATQWEGLLGSVIEVVVVDTLAATLAGTLGQ